MEIAMWMNIDGKNTEQQEHPALPHDQYIPDKESFSHTIKQQHCVFLIQVNF